MSWKECLENPDRVKRTYPPGTVVMLTKRMLHQKEMHKGLEGRVVDIDERGTLMVQWMNGILLGLLVGIDEFQVVGMQT